MYYIKILEAIANKKDNHDKLYDNRKGEKSSKSYNYQRRILITNIVLLVMAAGICFLDVYHTHALITARDKKT